MLWSVCDVGMSWWMLSHLQEFRASCVLLSVCEYITEGTEICCSFPWKLTNNCISVLHNIVVRMGEVEIDQRLRDLQREYLDFLDDEVRTESFYVFV
jgi:hypothetical protein